MNKPNLSYVTYTTFIKLIEKLETKISASKIKYDYIISLQRGGALMSLIMSDLLSIPIATITISSYENTERKRAPTITQNISVNITNKKVLILDEICDTGETIKVATKYLKKLNPKIIHTATFFTKSHSAVSPTYSIKKDNNWIIFPYELKETSNSVLMLDQLTKNKIQSFYKDCGYSKKFIKKYENSK